MNVGIVKIVLVQIRDKWLKHYYYQNLSIVKLLMNGLRVLMRDSEVHYFNSLRQRSIKNPSYCGAGGYNPLALSVLSARCPIIKMKRTEQRVEKGKFV